MYGCMDEYGCWSVFCEMTMDGMDSGLLKVVLLCVGGVIVTEMIRIALLSIAFCDVVASFDLHTTKVIHTFHEQPFV